MTLSADVPLVRPRPKWLRRVGLDANWGDAAFRVLTGAFALIVVVTLGAMALSPAQGLAAMVRTKAPS